MLVVEAGAVKLPEFTACRMASPLRLPDGWVPECKLPEGHGGPHLCKLARGGSVRWISLGRRSDLV